MLKENTGKTQAFLGKAVRQHDSPTQEDSSIAKATRVFPSAAEAEEAFSFLQKRLFHIEHWNACSEISSFELFGADGNSQPKKVAVGDFIKISLPGSGKDDWVNIVQIHETPDEVILTLKPSHDPTDKDNKDSTSHFFSGDSTNNFCLQRKDAKINFYVIGLNEKTNTEDTSGILETARNFATANIGCLLGIQKAQWETFCKNFLEVRNGK